tara:strand:+ start:2826 stop:3659 length:834 start_codon:yes stop_codon:yes gene_type:complete
MSFRVSHKSTAWPVVYHGNGPAKNNPVWKRVLDKCQNQEGWQERRPIIEDMTVITWSIPGETTMLEECFEKMGIKGELVVIPISKPFNWLDKITKTNDYLKKIDTKYILGLDSTDIIISTDFSGQTKLWYEIKEAFKGLNCKLLFNAEKLNWPSSKGKGTNIQIDGMNSYLLDELVKTEKFEEKVYKKYFGSEFFRLNSGAFIGYTDYTREFYQTLCDEHIERVYEKGFDEGLFGGDQGFIRIMQRRCFPDLTIDYRNKIFMSFADANESDIKGIYE